MAATDMTREEREAFLAGVHVGILAIERTGKGPLALPVWYQYDDHEVIISIDTNSAKAKLLRRHGRATLTVQDETPPYRYVMVEGPVAVAYEDRDGLPLAVRYLGDEIGEWYARQNPPTENSAIVRLSPETWLTCDYGKVHQ